MCFGLTKGTPGTQFDTYIICIGMLVYMHRVVQELREYPSPSSGSGASEEPKSSLKKSIAPRTSKIVKIWAFPIHRLPIFKTLLLCLLGPFQSWFCLQGAYEVKHGTEEKNGNIIISTSYYNKVYVIHNFLPVRSCCT